MTGKKKRQAYGESETLNEKLLLAPLQKMRGSSRSETHRRRLVSPVIFGWPSSFAFPLAPEVRQQLALLVQLSFLFPRIATQEEKHSKK
jgi:hypothetical protein